MGTPFEPKSVIVTGAGRGIGRAVAAELAAPGVTVAVLARSADELAGTAKLVRDRGGDAVEVPVDLSDPAGIGAAVTRVREVAGPIDTLVNNAGMVGPLGPTAQVDPAVWARSIALNVVAVATLSLAVLPEMLEAGRGRIVNVSSGVASGPGSMIGGNAYVTGKTALEAHTLNLALELAGTGVTVNAYRPGAVETAMQGWIREQDPAEIGAALHGRFVRMHDEGSLFTPEQAAHGLVEHLRGDENGQVWDFAGPSD